MEMGNLFPGDTQAWEATTDKLNHEWGFALKNAQGKILREIGPNKFNRRSAQKDLPRALSSRATRAYTPTADTSIASLISTRPQHRSESERVRGFYVVRAKSRAIPTANRTVDAAERALMTSALEAHPPRGLGFSYIMYGWNNLGVCTMNAPHVLRPVIRLRCARISSSISIRGQSGRTTPFVTDDRRCGTWQHAYAPWSDQSWWWRTDKLGSVEENDTTEWRFDFKYSGGVEIRIGKDKEYFNLFPWSGDSGVDTINSISLGFNSNFHRTGVPGTCYLSAVWPTRAPRIRSTCRKSRLSIRYTCKQLGLCNYQLQRRSLYATALDSRRGVQGNPSSRREPRSKLSPNLISRHRIHQRPRVRLVRVRENIRTLITTAQSSATRQENHPTSRCRRARARRVETIDDSEIRRVRLPRPLVRDVERRARDESHVRFQSARRRPLRRLRRERKRRIDQR